MPRINQQLFERLRSKLGVGERRVYELIDAKVRNTHLPRHLAAIALASERGINISRFAASEDLAEIRQAARAAAPAPVVVPAPQGARPETPTRPGRRSTRRRPAARRR